MIYTKKQDGKTLVAQLVKRNPTSVLQLPKGWEEVRGDGSEGYEDLLAKDGHEALTGNDLERLCEIINEINPAVRVPT